METFPWPNGRLCAATICFGVEGEINPYLVDRENAHRRMSLMSESVYGPKVGIPRILNLLDLYEIKASFFIPGRVVELHPELCREIVARGHDLGPVGFMHERLDRLSDALEEKVLLKTVATIEAATGKRPDIFRSPSWEMKPSTPALIYKHGYRVDSSLMGSDVPYWVETPAGERLLELPVTWTLDEFLYYGYNTSPSEGKGPSAPSKGLEIFREEFDAVFERGGYYNITFHDYLAGRPSIFKVLERLIRHIRQYPRVWIAPLSEIARHCMQPEIAAQLAVETTEIPGPEWVEE